MNPLAQFPTRTTKQPLRWRCRNPECIEQGKPHEFDDDHGTCPKCSDSPPQVLLMTLIHLMVRVPTGPILGLHRARLALACEPTRGFVTDGANNEAATGDPAATNCPGCLAALSSGRLKAPSQQVISVPGMPTTTSADDTDTDTELASD